MMTANRGWMIVRRGGCSVKFRSDLFLMIFLSSFSFFFFWPVWRAAALLGPKRAQRWMAEGKGTERRMGERNHFRSIVDERLELRPYLWSSKEDGTHAQRNHKTLIVTETYGQACGGHVNGFGSRAHEDRRRSLSLRSFLNVLSELNSCQHRFQQVIDPFCSALLLIIALSRHQ